MALTFLGALAISLFISGVQILMRSKVKRPKPEDFAVPKAQEGALVAQGSGIYAVAGNVVWVGDVSNRPSTSNDQITLYFANMLIRLGIGPADELVDIQIGDRSLALTPFSKEQFPTTGDPGTSVLTPQLPQPLTGDGPLTVTVHAHVLFGGDLQEGGVQGEVRLYRGTLDQPIDELTIRQFNQIAGFEGLGLGTRRPGIILLAIGTTDAPFYWGVVPQPKNVVVILRTIPRALLDLNLDPDHYTSAEIGNNCNPAEFLYECKRDELRGLGQIEAEFDLASFVAAAARFQAEGLGISYPGSSSVPARDIITDVCGILDAVLFEDLSTGKWTLDAMRPDDREGDVVAITPSTVIKGSLRVTRPDWSETKTEAVLTYRRFDVSPGTPIVGELLTPNLVFHPAKVANALQLKGKDVSDVHIFGDDGSGPVEIDPAAYRVNPTSGLVSILTWGFASLGTGFEQHTRVTANYLSGPFMGFHDASVRKEDDANRQRLGRPELLEINSAYITDDFVAGWACARALHKGSRRLARAQFKVNRTAYAIRPGSPIDVTDERTGTVIPMRVNTLDLGLLEQGEIGVDAIEDVFGASVAPAFGPGPNTTPGNLRICPPMAALYCSGADTLTLQASDPAFSIELQRADDTDGTGAETVAESPLAGDTTTYVDVTTGKTHRARQVRDGFVPGPWTPWISVCTTGTDECITPTYTVASDPATGVVTLLVDDPNGRITVDGVRFRLRPGGGPWSAWATATADGMTYSATVDMLAGQTSRVEWEIDYHDCAGDLQTLEGGVDLTVAVPEPEPAPESQPIELILSLGCNVLEIPAAYADVVMHRGGEVQFPLEAFGKIRIPASIKRAGTLGSKLRLVFEAIGAPGVYANVGLGDLGPTLALDADSLDLLDPVAGTPPWVVAGPWFTIREEAKGDVRVKLQIGEGDDATGDFYAPRVSMQLDPRPLPVDPPEERPIPPDNPGSCDVAAELDDFGDYADLAAFDAAWPED